MFCLFFNSSFAALRLMTGNMFKKIMQWPQSSTSLPLAIKMKMDSVLLLRVLTLIASTFEGWCKKKKTWLKSAYRNIYWLDNENKSVAMFDSLLQFKMVHLSANFASLKIKNKSVFTKKEQKSSLENTESMFTSWRTFHEILASLKSVLGNTQLTWTLLTYVTR